MLSHRKDPRTVYKSYAYAAAAKMEGVDFYFFSPGRVNFKNRTILGWIYENGRWIEKVSPFPDVIYNSSPPITEKQEIIVNRLSKEIPFTSHSVGDKLKVYQKIKTAKTFASYLVPSMEVLHVQDVYKSILKYQKTVLKPSRGHKGKNVFYVQRNEGKFILQQDKETVINEVEFREWVSEIINTENYIIQPYIQCKTKNGLSYDFRLHVQKDGKGDWNLITIFPRIAPQGIVTNLSKGGYTSEFHVFLKKEFNEEYYNVKRYLEHFAVRFSSHFDSLYDESLDELGIDVGLDSNQKIWIFEVNWRPGSPVSFSQEIDAAKQMIRYARFLAETSSMK